MIQGPNLDNFVVCRAKENIGRVQIGEVGNEDILPPFASARNALVEVLRGDIVIRLHL